MALEDVVAAADELDRATKQRDRVYAAALSMREEAVKPARDVYGDAIRAADAQMQADFTAATERREEAAAAARAVLLAVQHPAEAQYNAICAQADAAVAIALESMKAATDAKLEEEAAAAEELDNVPE